jgi:hypothetical protein
VAVIAQPVFFVRIAAKRTIRDDVDFGEQSRERAHRGGFRRAAFAANQDSADQRVDRVQHERAFHSILVDNRGKWKNWASHFCSD